MVIGESNRLNNFAVSSDGLATALQDSASALMEGGNNLEQSVALIAAANKVVQDPNSVGSALRTISLRLRGTSTEILQEMGEETDGVITSVSKLQSKIQALSGVNILTESGDYKDTYTILKEIGQVWEDMNDIDQAALLELMAGKNRANTLSAILGNMSDLTSAYETAMNAEGSAARENATYMDSIQGRIDQFNNAVQTMWMNFIDSDVIKFLVDVGTLLVGLIDKIGLLGTAIGAVLSVSSLRNKNDSFGNTLNKLVANGLNKVTDKFTSDQDGTFLDPIKKVFEGGINNAIGKPVEQLDDFASAGKNAGDIADQVSAQMENLGVSQEVVGNSAVTAGSNVEALGSAQVGQQVAAKGASTANTANAASETAVGVAAEAASWKVRLLTSALTFGLSLIAGALIQAGIKALNDFIHREERAAEAAKELTDEYKKAKSVFDDNLTSLTTSSDSDIYASLEDEFKVLARGVNAYGENISLTSDQYSRYKQICEKIVGIQPSIVEGYDSATEAIGNNAGILSQLIELQKEEARYSAQKYTNDENMGEIAENAINTYDKATKKIKNYIYSNGAGGIKGIYNLLYNVFDWNDVGSEDYGDKSTNSDDLAKVVLQSIGYTDDQISNELEKYYNNNGYFQYSQWITDYATVIAENKNKIAETIKAFSMDNDIEDKSQDFLSWASDFTNAEKELEVATDGMVSSFLQIPLSMEEYDDLSEGSKSFITKWIKNSDMFKLDDDFTQEEALKLRNQIRTIIREFASGDYITELSDGTEVTAQDILDQMFSIDTNNIDFGEYKNQMQELIDLLWNAIGGESNTLGFDDKGVLAVQLGIKFVGEEEDSGINEFKRRVVELTGKTEEEVQEWIDSSPVGTVEAMVNLDLSAQSEGITLEDIEDMVKPFIVSLPVEFKTYSGLSESVESFNEALKTSNELFADGAKTTEDYFDSLVKLGIDKSKLSEAIDPGSYIVTDAVKLKELIKAQKEELATETKLAKSQAQLKYHDLVRSLGDVVSSTMVFSEENDAAAESILNEIATVKKAINQYQLLEDSLLGVTNAFEDFASAQELDSQNTYGDSYVEMAQTMYDAIYKTGEVGTEAFWAAVRANVPSDIYADLAPGKDQIRAIAKYLNENVFSTLTLSDESFSIDYSDIEDFVEKAQDAGVFTGIDASSFGLSADFLNSLDDGEDALQAFADKLGMTKTQVYAMLSEMDKYNADGIGFSMLFQLDNSTEGKIAVLTSELEKLYIERQKLIKQGADEDILSANSQDILEVKSQLDEVKQQSVEIVVDYAEVDNAIAHTDAKLQDVMSEDLIMKLGLEGDITVGEQLEKIQDAMLLLEEPVVMDLETAKKEIEDLEKLNPTIEAHVELGENGKYEIIDSYDFVANGGNIEDLEYYVELKNAESFINTSLEEGLTTTETLLSKINENVAIIAGEEPESNESKGNENSIGFGGAQRSGGSGQANAGAGNETPDREYGGRGGNFGNSQDNKPERNQEEIKYNMELEHDIYEFIDALGQRESELQSIYGPLSMQQQTELDNILKLKQKASELLDEFYDPNGAPSANLRVYLSELQTDAGKYGVEIPVKPVADDDIEDAIEDENTTVNVQVGVDTESAESAGEKVAEIAQGAASSMPVIVESETGLSNPNDFKTTPVKSYSQLQGDVESFNSILSENEEIIGNNIEVTQEYKESLAELLGIEVKELDKYFDGNNKLLVKNADGLKKLTKEAKNNTKQNIKLAKSQAQLEYVELVNQLDDMLNVTDDLTDKNIDAANSLLSQIDSVQRTILKYQMLEESLLGAADAFKKFESAKEIDSQNTYGDSYIEMAQTIYDAYYKTGEVGSEAVRSAVEALIDPSVYAGLERGSEEYNQAIYDAFNKTVLPTLTLNEDTLSIDYESVEQFVTNGLGKIFTGTGIKDFDLMDGLNFEDAAKSMGMTTTQLYAMLAALKQFTGRDYLHEFVDGSISGGIMNITSKIEELNREKLELMNDGVTEEEQKRIDEINVALAQNKQELQELGAQAYNTWQEYTKVDGALNVLDEVQDKGQKVSEVFPKDFVTDLGLTGEETVQEAYDALLKKQLELEQPTKLTMTYAIDNIDDQIKELETALETGDYTNIGPISFDLKFGKTPEEQIKERIDALKDDKAAIAVAFNIELSEEEREDLEKQLESIEQFKINDKVFTVTGNTSATMLKLRALKLLLDKINGKEIKIKTNYSTSGTPNNGRTRVNGTAHVDGTAFKTGSWGASRTETALVGELGPELVNL